MALNTSTDGVRRPFDQEDIPSLDFESGERIGYNAAPTVKIGGSAVDCTRCAMRMSTDNDLMISLDPTLDARLNFIQGFFGALMLLAPEAEKLNISPDIAKHKSAQDVKAVTFEIGLVSMDDENALSRSGVAQD